MTGYKKAFRKASPYTIPVLTGYLFIGTAFGIVSGYIMEVLFVKLKPKGSIGIRIIRFFIGACGLLFIMNCLGGFGAFVNNFIVGFYIIYLYPAIFSKLNL